MKHPPSEHLEATLRSLGQRESSLFVHLLRCLPCSEIARRVLGLDPAVDPRHRKGVVLSKVSVHERLWPGLDRTLTAAIENLAEARKMAPRLAEELLAFPAEERDLALHEEPLFHSLALGHFLLTTAKALPLDLRIERVLMVIAIADVLTERQGSQATRAALRSSAGLDLAEALRERGDLIQAEIELTAVAVYLEASADLLDRAHYVRALALLRRDQQRPEEAFALFDRAADLLAEIGETINGAHVRILCGELHLQLGDPREAFECADVALSTFLGATERNPALTYRAARCAAQALVLCERSDEAITTLDLALRGLAGHPEALRAFALRGRIETGTRRYEAAAKSFRSAITGWRLLGEPLAEARASIWLAETLIAGSTAPFERDLWSAWFADLVEGLERLAKEEIFPLEVQVEFKRLADGLVDRQLPSGIVFDLAAALDLLRSSSHSSHATEEGRVH